MCTEQIPTSTWFHSAPGGRVGREWPQAPGVRVSARRSESRPRRLKRSASAIGLMAANGRAIHRRSYPVRRESRRVGDVLRMTRLDQVPEIEAHGVVVSTESDHIGNLVRVIVNQDTQNIDCVTVMTGWRRRTECFIPLHDATIQLNEIRVPYDRRMVKRAPRAGFAMEGMTAEHSALVFEHYGVTADMVTLIVDFGDYVAPQIEQRLTAIEPPATNYCIRACQTTATGPDRIRPGAGRSYHAVAQPRRSPTDDVPPGSPKRVKYSAQEFQNRRKTPGILALAVVLVVMITVSLVLAFAGGNRTADGTGRNQLADFRSPATVAATAGNGTGGPVR